MSSLLTRRFAANEIRVEPITGLPLYHATEVAWTSSEKRAIASHVGARAVRWMKLSTNTGFMNLREALDVADDMFDEIASLCGAQVPEHTWGVAKAPKSRPQEGYTRLPNPLLPPKLELVADTQIIRGLQPLTAEESAAIKAELAAYNASDAPYTWEDASPEQFAARVGTTGDGSRERWLLDFDPYVRRNPSQIRIEQYTNIPYPR